MINHPVHMMNNSLSAFIPFCTFGDYLYGEKVGKLRFSGCNRFREKLVNGGVCYEIRVKPDKMMTRVNWNEVIQRGVGVVIDTGEEYDVRNLFGMKKSGKDQIS